MDVSCVSVTVIQRFIESLYEAQCDSSLSPPDSQLIQKWAKRWNKTLSLNFNLNEQAILKFTLHTVVMSGKIRFRY